MSGWQAVYEDINDDNFVLIAAAQDTGGEAVAGPWYDQAKASYITLVDENHSISSLFKLVNVPSAVWIDERGKIIRIDEGTYATTHKMGDFEFGRDDYAPMVKDWVKKGAASEYAQDNAVPKLAKSSNDAMAEANFKLGVYFYRLGDTKKQSSTGSPRSSLTQTAGTTTARTGPSLPQRPTPTGPKNSRPWAKNPITDRLRTSTNRLC